MARTPGLQIAVDATVFLEGDNEAQPDVCLFRLNPPGSARVVADKHDTEYIQGAPELVMEIAASSASYDLHDKLAVYQRNGVLEYIVWQVRDKQISWFRLTNDGYVRVEPHGDVIIESAVFPGLCLDIAAMLAGDAAGVLAALDRPRRSP
jgi:Uma2 family endonuclease